MSEGAREERSTIGLEGHLPVCGHYDPQVVARLYQRLINSPLEPRFSANSISVLKDRYFRRNEAGEFEEDGKGMVARIASYVAYAEQGYNGKNEELTARVADEFYGMMARGEFIPNSPALMNAGREMGMLSACFVLPLRDSIKGIFCETGSAIALVQKSGGGTGVSFDDLRPTGDYIKGSGGTTSGPIAFWKALAEVTNAIQQGSFRRGANMGMMSVERPDILKFINAKAIDGAFSNYNISVKLRDKWMSEMTRDPASLHIVTNPRTGKQYYLPKWLDVAKYSIKDLVPADGTKVDASNFFTRGDIWNELVRHAHAYAEPGIVFIDRMNRDNPTPQLGSIEGTNPCGEEPLLPYEACNLGHINLAKVVENKAINWGKLKSLIKAGVRFLDDIIDVNHLPIPEIVNMVRGNRSIGLGVLGFADMLINMDVAYGSEESYQIADQIAKFLRQEADDTSAELAKERGVFPNWKGSIYDPESPNAKKEAVRELRNSRRLTIAPTGTTGIIIGAYGGGIECIFDVMYTHRDSKGTERKFLLDFFVEELKKSGVDHERVLSELSSGKRLKDLDFVPERIRKIYVGAHDLTPEQHVRMQAIWQGHVDASISKTINLVHDAPVEAVDQAYRLAYQLGCKGITVYRDGSRKGQPLTSGKSLEAKVEQGNVLKRGETKPLPDYLPASYIKQMTPWGHLHLHVSYDPQARNNKEEMYKEVQVFAQLGKGGEIVNADLEGLCRMASTILRLGGDMEMHVIPQLEGIGSQKMIPTIDGPVVSLPDGLARALKNYVELRKKVGVKALLLGDYDLSQLKKEKIEKKMNGNGAEKNSSKHEEPEDFGIKCEKCGGKAISDGKCWRCSDPTCTWSKC